MCPESRIILVNLGEIEAYSALILVKIGTKRALGYGMSYCGELELYLQHHCIIKVYVVVIKLKLNSVVKGFSFCQLWKGVEVIQLFPRVTHLRMISVQLRTVGDLEFLIN